ncbi:MAG: PQQ-like beta-propeller repeat protein [Phycisphaerae bacterium]|nr:PQQ-like beta-propeller repeat protein [Phycisphaerae bacterium]NUQ47569.1 PQQ-like beta-propeller repeat protein [Phycisphaerae bacterium]
MTRISWRSTVRLRFPSLPALCSTGAVALFVIASDAAAQWPQWGGPRRDFTADAAKLATQWPDGGPKKLWSRELGDGYAAICVDDGKLYTLYRLDQKADEEKGVKAVADEVVVCLDAATGRTIWEHRYEAPLTKDMGMEFGPGPHSTPLIVGDRLVTIGCTMIMHCLDRKSGKPIWSHDFAKEYKAEVIGRGYAASPIAWKNTIIVPVGGKGQAVVAFDVADGRIAWKKHDFQITHASPLLINVDGEEQLVMFMGEEVVGLRPADGELLWSHPHKTQYGANICTPVWGRHNILFISSAYGMGSRGIQLSRKDGKTTATELWYNAKMKIHFSNAVGVGDRVFGSSGDFGPCFLAAVNIKTGEFAWKERGIKKSNLVYADGKLVVVAEDGMIALVQPGDSGATILAKATLLENNAWTVPTIVGNTLYIRDRKHVMALDLG